MQRTTLPPIQELYRSVTAARFSVVYRHHIARAGRETDVRGSVRSQWCYCGLHAL